MATMMYERTFVVFVDPNLPADSKEVVLTAASELFCVSAQFDSESDDGGNVKWISVKSRNSENNDAAKAYIIACFHPQSRCPQIICAECCDLLQDANGLWWRSLEHEFKIRMSVSKLDQDTNQTPMEASATAAEEGTENLKLEIQGDQEAVAFASSYITELNKMLTLPPEEANIDKGTIRREFTNELMNFSELKWGKYSSYNPYVLRTLLKWIYFVKGIIPSNEDYVLSMPPPVNDSLVVLESDDDGAESNKTSNKTNDPNRVKIINNDVIDISDDIDSLSSSSTSEMDAERKTDGMAPVSSSSNGSNIEISKSGLSVSVAAAGGRRIVTTPSQVTSSVAVRASTSPSGQTHWPLGGGAVWGASESANNSPPLTTAAASATRGNGVSSSSEMNTNTNMNRIRRRSSNDDDNNGITSQSSTSSLPEYFHGAPRIVIPQPAIPELILPPDMYKNVEFSKLRPVVIDGSNVAMQQGMNKRFHCRAIMLAAKHFIERGHMVLAFVPQYRHDQYPNNYHKPIEDQWMLGWMEMRRLCVFTPSRQVIKNDGQTRRYACYDDNMIVQYAHMSGGVILSKDNYRDVAINHPEWASTIEHRLVMFSWIGEDLWLPVDPCGKTGPSLEYVLRFHPDERVEKPAQPATEEKCRNLLQEIHEALHRAPPPERQMSNMMTPSWNRSNANYRFRPYQDWREMNAEPRPFVSNASQSSLQMPRPLMSVPVAQPHAFESGAVGGGFAAFSSQFRNNNADEQRKQRRLDNNTSPETTRRDGSASPEQRRAAAAAVLQEMFSEDLVQRVMSENRSVTDVSVLSNIILNIMSSY